jgi:acylglycerol lipase
MTHNFTILNNDQKLNIITHNILNRDSPSAVLIHIHGLGGHFQAKYDKFDSFNYYIKMFPPNVVSYGLEIRGHGLSDGTRFMINNFDDYLIDLDRLIEWVKINHPLLPIFILGCSMGGAIATKYSIVNPNKISGLILLAPMTGVSEELQQSWIKVNFMFYLSYIVPSYKMISISTNNCYIDEYMLCKKDCIYQNRESIRLDTTRECYNAMVWIQENCYQLTIPIIAFHSSFDNITSSKTTEIFIDRCSSTDKTLFIYDKGYHNLLVPIDENDNQPNIVLNTISEWLNKRIV